MGLAILSNVSLHGFLKKVPSWDHVDPDPGINWYMRKPPMDGIWFSPIFIGYVSIIFCIWMDLVVYIFVYIDRSKRFRPKTLGAAFGHSVKPTRLRNSRHLRYTSEFSTL